VESEGRVKCEWRVKSGDLFGRLRARGERPLREGRLEGEGRSKNGEWASFCRAAAYLTDNRSALNISFFRSSSVDLD
jgi:hypothetical protein